MLAVARHTRKLQKFIPICVWLWIDILQQISSCKRKEREERRVVCSLPGERVKITGRQRDWTRVWDPNDVLSRILWTWMDVKISKSTCGFRIFGSNLSSTGVNGSCAPVPVLCFHRICFYLCAYDYGDTTEKSSETRWWGGPNDHLSGSPAPVLLYKYHTLDVLEKRLWFSTFWNRNGTGTITSVGL